MTTKTKFLAFASMLSLFTGIGASTAQASTQTGTIVIGSKNFTESTIMGDMLADLIQAKTHLKVVEKLNLGATAITYSAITSGNIDLYTEYTGTLYSDYLKNTAPIAPGKVYPLVNRQLQRKLHLELTKPLGFDNTFTLAVPRSLAQKFKLKTFGDLARISNQLELGIDPEFEVRTPDGWPGLEKAYGFHFKKVVTVDNGIKYPAIQQNKVQVIDAFTTDGQLKADNLVILQDSKNFFQQYNAVPVVRMDTLQKYPQLKAILNMLGGKISTLKMQELNYLVDVKHEDPNTVAKSFLRSIGFIK